MHPPAWVTLVVLWIIRVTHAQSTVQVSWNDSRVVYSSPSLNLWNQTWDVYNTVVNASTHCAIPAYQDLCSGFLSLCQVNDTASFSFIGTSVTVKFLDRWNGNEAVTLLLDGQFWTSVNTSNANGEPWPSDTQALTSTAPVCIPTSVAKTALANQVHNVTVMVPQSDPRYGYVELFQGFDYTGSTSIVPLFVPSSTISTSYSANTITSSTSAAQQSAGHTSHTGPIVGGVIGAIVLIGLVAAATYFVLRRKARSVAVGRNLDFDEKNFSKRKVIHDGDIAISPYDPSIPTKPTGSLTTDSVADTGRGLKDGTSMTLSSKLLLPRVGSAMGTGGSERQSHLEVIQGLLDQGVPGAQIASVIKLIEEEAAMREGERSHNVGSKGDSGGPTTVASPPPQYEGP